MAGASAIPAGRPAVRAASGRSARPTAWAPRTRWWPPAWSRPGPSRDGRPGGPRGAGGSGLARRPGQVGEGDGGPRRDAPAAGRRAALRNHAGQPAFPGGAVDDGDDGAVAAALREAAEEALVDPAGVQVLTVLPEMYISRSGYRVSPVLAWWREPGPVAPGNPAEVTAVARVALADLADPANRMMVRYPSGQPGPAFRAGPMLVWGFTAFLLDRLLALGGWELPWDAATVSEPPGGISLAGPGPS